MLSISIEKTSVPGDSTAPATSERMIATRRNRESAAGVTSPKLARIMITSGSSKEIPIATISWTTKSKYFSNVIIVASESVWKLNSTWSACGTTNTKASTAPTRKRPTPTESAGTTIFRSRR